MLLQEAQSKDIRVARDVYERFLIKFPTAVCTIRLLFLLFIYQFRVVTGNNMQNMN